MLGHGVTDVVKFVKGEKTEDSSVIAPAIESLSVDTALPTLRQVS
jgi:hypothetical protein